MGLLTNKMEKEELKPGDHIYTYRAVFAYSHHGIFVGGSKVVHFRPEHNLNPSSLMESSFSPSSASSSSEDICPTFPDCGFRQPNSGVVLSCLDCFLKNGSLYCFEYGVSPSVFLTIGTIIERTNQKCGISIQDDVGNVLHIEDPTSIKTPLESDDPFRLVKSALLVTDIVQENSLQSTGLAIKTWANVPCGSGLGTSSILAAAVVKGLLQISNGDESNENVARLVLVLEQFMGTGVGWQDQIGGLYPGIKFTSSFPGIPLRLQVVPLLASPQLVSELQQRLLVVFTGQVRLAHQVLHKVVTRYLQRDNLLISSIKRLTELAKSGREALMNCEVDELGDIMSEAWRLHQELDPYCSNEFVDKLFAFAQPYSSGFKLVGAGGGGFSLILAKDTESATELRQRLEENPEFDVKVYNWSICI